MERYRLSMEKETVETARRMFIFKERMIPCCRGEASVRQVI